MIKFTIIENQTKEFEQAVAQEMEKVIKHFDHELAALRTNRAHPAMVEGVKITCYGGTTELSLKELATISAPDPRLIVIQPWDKSIINDIERAILGSNLGLTPINDGELIRIQLPEMSQARRADLAKVLNEKLEETRIAIRNVRRDFHNLVRDSQRDKTISEDFSRRLDDSLKKVTDQFIKNAETLSQKKEESIRE